MIQYQNLVNQDNYVKPNYDVIQKELYIKLYISPDKELCIVGELDNNYMVWCSFTNLSAVDLNNEIFSYITQHTFQHVSTLFKVLGNIKIEQIQTWYVCSIVKSTLPYMTWETPFGHYYGNDTDNHGKYFSRDIQVFYDDLIKKSEHRTFGTHYKDVLRGYQHILAEDEDVLYYTKIKPLVAILEAESYLLLSQDLEIRTLYLSCRAETIRLYNRYMTAVR